MSLNTPLTIHYTFCVVHSWRSLLVPVFGRIFLAYIVAQLIWLSVWRCLSPYRKKLYAPKAVCIAWCELAVIASITFTVAIRFYPRAKHKDSFNCWRLLFCVPSCSCSNSCNVTTHKFRDSRLSSYDYRPWHDDRDVWEHTSLWSSKLTHHVKPYKPCPLLNFKQNTMKCTPISYYLLLINYYWSIECIDYNTWPACHHKRSQTNNQWCK